MEALSILDIKLTHNQSESRIWPSVRSTRQIEIHVAFMQLAPTKHVWASGPRSGTVSELVGAWARRSRHPIDPRKTAVS